MNSNTNTNTNIYIYITTIVYSIIINRNLINSIVVVLYKILIMNLYLDFLFFVSIGRCSSSSSSLTSSSFTTVDLRLNRWCCLCLSLPLYLRLHVLMACSVMID